MVMPRKGQGRGPGAGPRGGGDQARLGLDLTADAAAGDAVEVARHDDRTLQPGAQSCQPLRLADLAVGVLEGPGPRHMDGDQADRPQRRLGLGDQGGQALTVGVAHPMERQARGDHRTGGAAGPVLARRADPVRVGAQDRVQLRGRGVAQFDQHDHIGVGLFNGAGDGRHILISGPQVCGIDGQGFRSGGAAFLRRPLGPDGQKQQPRHARAQRRHVP